jgi:hypothetical protein
VADDPLTPKRNAGRSGETTGTARRRTSKSAGARALEERPPTQITPSVPVDPEPVRPLDRTERVARRAYELYAARGGTGGDQFQDWLEAERQIDAEDAKLDRR